MNFHLLFTIYFWLITAILIFMIWAIYAKRNEIKTVTFNFTLPVITILCLYIYSIFEVLYGGNKHTYPVVDLPEEWQAITPKDTLQGQLRNDTLFITFKHSK